MQQRDGTSAGELTTSHLLMHSRPIASLVESGYVVYQASPRLGQHMTSAIADNRGKDACISSQ